MVIELEIFVDEKMLDVLQVTRDKVIHSDHIKIFLHKTITEMGTDEPGSAGNEDAFGV
jgi:hypothetical protein